MRRTLPERPGGRTGGISVEVGRMQRGLGLRHGVRSKVPRRPGIGRWRFPESDELAQQQSRQKGIPTAIIIIITIIIAITILF